MTRVSCTVFQVVLRTAKLKPAAALQVLRQGREGLVFQAVGHLATHAAVGQRLAGGDKVGLDGVVIAPHDLFQRAALGPLQALDGQVQKRNHDAAGAFADLRELPAVKKYVLHRRVGGGQKVHGQISTNGRRHHQRQPGYTLCFRNASTCRTSSCLTW